MSAAAGIVVIEIATPTSAADLPSVTESMPAAPAQSATTTEKPSGAAIASAIAFPTRWNSSGAIPTTRSSRVDANASAIAAVKPTATARKPRTT